MAKELNVAKKNKKNIIAVGTTVVRTLESAVNRSGQLEKLSEQQIYLLLKTTNYVL